MAGQQKVAKRHKRIAKIKIAQEGFQGGVRGGSGWVPGGGGGGVGGGGSRRRGRGRVRCRSRKRRCRSRSRRSGSRGLSFMSKKCSDFSRVYCCEFNISVVCFVSRCAFFMPSVGSSLAKVPAAASTCFVPDLRSVLITCFQGLFPLIVVSQLFTKSAPLESEWSGRDDRDPPDVVDDGRGRDWGDGGECGLAVAEVHPGNGRSGGRATRNVIRDDARLLDPTTATERGTISNSRNPASGGTPPQRSSGGEFS